MSDDNTQLELEKIRFERSKLRYDLAKVIITVLIGTFGVAYMNHIYQNRQLEQQRRLNEAELQLQEKKTEMELQLQQKKTEAELQLQQEQADAERRQAEMKYLGDFLTYALEDDVEKRIRFASYFARLTVSPDLQKKWEEYYGVLRDLVVEAQQREEELRIAIETEQDEKVQELTTEVARLRSQLAALPKEPQVTQDVFPYTTNEFEVQGDVVLDQSTGLMWQQSGSESPLTFLKALEYIRQLNAIKFAGYDDWRLPTIYELITLLEPEKQSNGLYIDPLFDATQRLCFSVTALPEESESGPGVVWGAHFLDGNLRGFNIESGFYVRAVRSGQ